MIHNEAMGIKFAQCYSLYSTIYYYECFFSLAFVCCAIQYIFHEMIRLLCIPLMLNKTLYAIMHNVILFILRQNVMSKCQCIFNLLLLNFGPASVDTS